jgi:hypothetical protein
MNCCSAVDSYKHDNDLKLLGSITGFTVTICTKVVIFFQNTYSDDDNDDDDAKLETVP